MLLARSSSGMTVSISREALVKDSGRVATFRWETEQQFRQQLQLEPAQAGLAVHLYSKTLP